MVSGLAIAAIIAAVSFRIWTAHPPVDVLRAEAVLIGVGVVFAGVCLAIKSSRWSTMLFVQLPIMVLAAVLTDLILGMAGPWLGDDLPPLAAVSFATVFLYFEAGLHSRRFGYVFGVAVLGLGALWIYAVTQLMVSLSAVTLWTLVLVGLGMLAYLTTRSVDRELGAQVERQSSLLATLSVLLARLPGLADAPRRVLETLG